MLPAACGDSPTAGSTSPASPVAAAFTPSVHPQRLRHRLLAPLSGSLAGSRRPWFRWDGPAQAQVEICAERDCDHLIEVADGHDHAARPRHPLPVGVIYWRVRLPGAPCTSTWELFVPPGGDAPSATRGLRYDADADGYVDAAVRDTNGDAQTDVVHVYRGGRFGLDTHGETLLALNLGGGGLVSLGDVNGDGFGDLALADARGVVVFPGSADGVVSTPLSVIPPTNPYQAFALAAGGDVDGDGYADLFVGDGMAKVFLYLGSASGLATTPAWTFDQTNTGRYTSIMTAADLDGDGYGDVVVQDYGPNGDTQAFRFFRGSAAGLEPPTAVTLVVRPTLPFGTAGDVDGDGIADLVTEEGSSLAIYLGGAGFPPAAPSQILTLATPPAPIQVGDFDGDGRFDVAAGASLQTSNIYFTDDTINVYRGGPGGVSVTPEVSIPETSVFPDNQLNFGEHLSSGDYGRRGHEDLLVAATVPFPTPYFDGSSGAAAVFHGSPFGLRSQHPLVVRGGPGYATEVTSAAPTYGGAF
ncbi:MAG TPA: VCBS repeat-containing protein [Polyangia bacterium]|nr:VCBS repeat-containing protein [Polyangia bacterium]